MTTKAAQILVVIPHPDDAEFGAAGTVARWIRKGKEVVYVVCTNGDKGTSDPEMTSARLAKTREKEQRSKMLAEGTDYELTEAFYRFELFR
tara:strand:+ start:3018 stop:3290 length:273 start_codon:yes stop_codon:yes gene_type:complete